MYVFIYAKKLIDFYHKKRFNKDPPEPTVVALGFLQYRYFWKPRLLKCVAWIANSLQQAAKELQMRTCKGAFC